MVVQCYMCGETATVLCDYPERSGTRCGAAMCGDCRRRGVTPDVDFCAQHSPLARKAYEQRLEKAAAGPSLKMVIRGK
jgi:hypothetical protein